MNMLSSSSPPQRKRNHVLRSYPSWSSVSTKVDGSEAYSISRRKSLSSAKMGLLAHTDFSAMSSSSGPIRLDPAQEEKDIVVLFQYPSAALFQLPVVAGITRRDYDRPPPLPAYMLNADNSEATKNAYLDQRERRQNTQKVASGKFMIYKLAGQNATYLKVGPSFVHPILPKTRLWRVLKDQFILPQPNPGKFWRLELTGLGTNAANDISRCGPQEGLYSEPELENLLRQSCSFQSTYVAETEQAEDDEDEGEAEEAMSVMAENSSQRSSPCLEPLRNRMLDLDPLGFPLCPDIASPLPSDISYYSLDRANHGLGIDEYPSPQWAPMRGNSLGNLPNSSSSTLDLILDSFEGSLSQANDASQADSLDTAHLPSLNQSQGQSQVQDPDQELTGDTTKHIHIHHHHHYPSASQDLTAGLGSNAASSSIPAPQSDNSTYWHSISNVFLWS